MRQKKTTIHRLVEKTEPKPTRKGAGRPAVKAAAKAPVKVKARAAAASSSAKRANATSRAAPKTKLAVKKHVKIERAARARVRSIRLSDPEAPPKPLAQTAKKKSGTRRGGRPIRQAKFCVGQVVRHRIYPFRGVVFDIDPVFANTDEWLAAIPANVRPRKNQPFYHLLAESAETEYIAYVSEQNLLADETGQPLRHPQISDYFVENDDGTLRAVFLQAH